MKTRKVFTTVSVLALLMFVVLGCDNGDNTSVGCGDCYDDTPVDCVGDDCDDDAPVDCEGDDCDDDTPVDCVGDDCDDDMPVVCEGAESEYFYYYGGERQYFELYTRSIFISIANEETADILGLEREMFQIDIVRENIRHEYNRRLWTELRLDSSMSNDAYLAKLSEIRSMGDDIIVAPYFYFSNNPNERIGLSNFLYVKVKSLSDTVLLRQETEKEHAVIVEQNQFMPEWFVVSVTANSRCNAMELSNFFYESRLFQYAEPDFMVSYEIYQFDSANDSHGALLHKNRRR